MAYALEDARDGGFFERSLEKRDEVRAKLVSDIPWWYNPWGHLAATTGIGMTVLVLSAMHLHAVRAWELAVVPLTAILSNFVEWRAHKKLLHRRTWPLQVLYDRHTPEHHVVYVEWDMALRSWRELRLVLIPAAGVLAIVLATAPFALLLGQLVSPNAGWLMLVTSASMMVSYELLHLSYHLPANSRIGGLGVVKVLRRHHARHHDPRLMQRWNFNVTVPLFDWVLGTLYRESERREHAAAPAE